MLKAVSELPTWAWVALYIAVALAGAEAVRRVTRAWLTRLADTTKDRLHEVLAASLPRPIGSAFFLSLIGIGARGLPLEEAATAKRLLPFGAGVLVVVALMRLGFTALSAYGASNPALKSTAGIGRAVMWIVGTALIAVLVSEAIGVSLAPALTALGVGSLAVALALQDTLSNFFAGIYLLADKPLRPGDFVRLEGGQEGYVETIGWRSTHLRTLAQSFIIVPNATLSKAVLTNFKDANPRLALEIRVDVAPDAELSMVASALGDEAARVVDVPGVVKEPSPYVRFLAGATDLGIPIGLFVRIEPGADAALVQHEVRRRMYACLARDGIRMAGSSSERRAATAVNPVNPTAAKN